MKYTMTPMVADIGDERHIIRNKCFDACRPTHTTLCRLKAPTVNVLDGDLRTATCPRCRRLAGLEGR